MTLAFFMFQEPHLMRSLTLSIVFVVLAWLSGCVGNTPEAAEVQPVTIGFSLMAAGRPVHCGTLFGPLGRDQKRVWLKDARVYVQDVALIDDAGRQVPLRLSPSDWQNTQVALLDFEDGTGHCRGGTPGTNTTVVGTVPAGRYTGLAFTVGVPEALNHTSTELEGPPLDVAAMGWSWQVGRKFAKIEVDPEGGVSKADGSKAATWYVHLGSTGCTGNPVTGQTVSCPRGNRVALRMNGFEPSKQVVTLDLAALFQGSHLSRDEGGAVGCMSGPGDPECVAVLEHLAAPRAPGARPAFSVQPTP
ncbi:metallo-mystery pair system four-Cys motif protein [Pseudomonas laurentiana]|nr:metallo-mystery pair system four-Cys motif protein [Pseudomonas laurentiana]